MLKGLYSRIRSEELDDFVCEAMGTKKSSDQLKSAFLDDYRADVIGAENDPTIKELIETIPEYDDTDPEIESEIAVAAESLMESELY